MEKLGDVVDFFNGIRKFVPVKVDLLEIFANEANKYKVDFSDVRGQENVKWAMEVALRRGDVVRKPSPSPKRERILINCTLFTDGQSLNL
jgi:hypothetical protein